MTGTLMGLLLTLAMSRLAGAGVARAVDLEIYQEAFGLVPEVTLGEVPVVHNNYTVAAIRSKLAQYAPVTVTADISGLTDREKNVLIFIIEAAKLMDPIFNRQVFRFYDETRAQLRARSGQSELAAAQLELLDMMRGPWDRQSHHAAFAVDTERPRGGGYYPAGVARSGEDCTLGCSGWAGCATCVDWDQYLVDHPEDRQQLESLVTMVVDRGNGEMAAQNYSTFFQEFLHPAHNHMVAASALTDNPSLKTFLRSRANAFITNDYYQSDKDWMDLDSKIEVTIGPYETYEDGFLGLKASFEAFVTLTDPVESAKLAKFKSYLPDMEQNLPIDEAMKTDRGAESPIRVVDLVFAAGDARKSVQTLAFNLPNDERVRKEKGAKKVMLKNQIANKFSKILVPIATELLTEDLLEFVDGEAFFYNILFHELSHSIGPAYVNNDQSQGAISKALGASYSAVEEAKADVMGVYNVLYMIQRGEISEQLRARSLVTYVAGLFRSIRFGVAESHGRGAALQLNTFLGSGAVTLDSVTGRYSVQLARLEQSVAGLVARLCTLQHTGDREAVEAELARLGGLDEVTSANLARLDQVPVDIRPCYPLAGESCPQPSKWWRLLPPV